MSRRYAPDFSVLRRIAQNKGRYMTERDFTDEIGCEDKAEPFLNAYVTGGYIEPMRDRQYRLTEKGARAARFVPGVLRNFGGRTVH